MQNLTTKIQADLNFNGIAHITESGYVGGILVPQGGKLIGNGLPLLVGTEPCNSDGSVISLLAVPYNLELTTVIRELNLINPSYYNAPYGVAIYTGTFQLLGSKIGQIKDIYDGALADSYDFQTCVYGNYGSTPRQPIISAVECYNFAQYGTDIMGSDLRMTQVCAASGARNGVVPKACFRLACSGMYHMLHGYADMPYICSHEADGVQLSQCKFEGASKACLISVADRSTFDDVWLYVNSNAQWAEDNPNSVGLQLGTDNKAYSPVGWSSNYNVFDGLRVGINDGQGSAQNIYPAGWAPVAGAVRETQQSNNNVMFAGNSVLVNVITGTDVPTPSVGTV